MPSALDLSAELNVPAALVIKTLIGFGVMRTVFEDIPADEVELIRSELLSLPPWPPPPPSSPPRDYGNPDAGVREPRRPHSPTLSGEAVPPEDP